MIIPQLGICSVIVNHKNKQKLCRIFVVPGNIPVLLGMSDIELLDVLTNNCNTIDVQASYNQIRKKQEDGWYCTSRPWTVDVQLQFHKNRKPIPVMIIIQWLLIILIIVKQINLFLAYMKRLTEM